MYVLNERQNNNYDFLRLFAAFCIAFTHSFNLLQRDADEPLMRLSGNRCDFSLIGLSIFFSVSGYLITKSAITSVSIKNYFWKRLLRIQPLLILVCIISVFLIGPLYSNLKASSYFSNIACWTYFRNVFPVTGIQFSLPGIFSNNVKESGINGSLWTLIVEERLYIFTGIFFLLAKRKYYYTILMAILNLVYAFRGSLFSGDLEAYLDGGHVFYAMLFLNAGLLYVLQIDFSRPVVKKIGLILLPGLVCALSFWQLSFMQVFLIPVFVIAFAHLHGITNRVGSRGDFTYGIYIFAFPVQQMLIASNLTIQPYLLFAETVFIVLPLAVLSWHLFEKKFLAMKSMLR
jgi:peptidoglycan/LPS O-acetylase OafA/YrhL